MSIKEKISVTITKPWNVAKGIIRSLLYVAAIASLGYGFWFAYKNRSNGHSPIVNVIAGIIQGVGKIIGSASDVLDAQNM